MRAPQLYETLRAFCLGTFRALLADIERGAELQFAFEEHTSYAKPALYEYRPLVKPFIEHRAHTLRKRTDAQRAAIARFFRFMAAHNYDWARTGHIPAFKSVLADPRFKSLPHRADIAPLAAIGRPLPSKVQRQNAIEGIVGEEAAAAFTGQKTIPRALGDAERRVDDLLGEVE